MQSETQSKTVRLHSTILRTDGAANLCVVGWNGVGRWSVGADEYMQQPIVSQSRCTCDTPCNVGAHGLSTEKLGCGNGGGLQLWRDGREARIVCAGVRRLMIAMR
jgi:hypothetical protein